MFSGNKVPLLLVVFHSFLVIFQLVCGDPRPENDGKSTKRKGISHQTFNFQFSDPLERVICTQGPGVDPRYNADFCKKQVFDELAQLNFFIIGDMGGSSVWQPLNPHTTHAQRSVAAAMQKLAIANATLQPHFVINLGDNFYLNGVRNTLDDRFRQTFEDVYDEKTLGVPWFPILGNHDYHGNVQAQIDYTNRSTRWTFPAKNADQPWYKIQYQFGEKATVEAPLQPRNSIVKFLMLDTVQLCGMTEDVSGDSWWHWLYHSSNSNPTKPIEGKEDWAKAQWDWVEKELQTPSSKAADFLFVVGHYPIYSVGKHGFFYSCLKRLDKLMRDNQVTAYLNGHDHNLQHLRVMDTQGKGLDYITSGAGAATDRSQDHWDEFKGLPGSAKVLFHYPAESWWWKLDEAFSWSTGGFVHAQVDAANGELVLSYFSGQGTVCTDNIPVVGSLFGLSKWGGPQNYGCSQQIYQTMLCARNGRASKRCMEAQSRVDAATQDQPKAGWFGSHWWCLWLC